MDSTLNLLKRKSVCEPLSSPLPPVLTPEKLESLKQHELLVSHPNFAQAYAQFSTFLKAVEEDLRAKCESLGSQRNSLLLGQLGLKNYLDCQLFMMSKHSRRVEQFINEVNYRLAGICQRFDELAAASIRKKSSAFSVDDKENRSEEEMQAVSEQQKKESQKEVGTDLLQLLSDMGKMKRRCKHILDVTDRYCVFSPHELDLKEAEKMPNKGPIIRRNSDVTLEVVKEDEPEFGQITDLGRKPSLGSRQSPEPIKGSPVCSPITQNIVKSTFESFGSHLAVLAKTYTKKKGSCEMSLAV